MLSLPILFFVPDACNPIFTAFNRFVMKMLQLELHLEDHAIGNSVAAADPSNHSFPTQQPAYSSTTKIGLRCSLTKSLASEIVPNHQEVLATTPLKKKNKKKNKATLVMPLFYEATH
jgi:hypothetical protein